MVAGSGLLRHAESCADDLCSVSLSREHQVWNTVTSPTILLCRKGLDVLRLGKKQDGMILPMRVCRLLDFRSLQTSSLLASNACSRATEAVQSFCGEILQGLWLANHHRSSLSNILQQTQCQNVRSNSIHQARFHLCSFPSMWLHCKPIEFSKKVGANLFLRLCRALPYRQHWFLSHDRWGQVRRISWGLEREHGLWQGHIPCNTHLVRHTSQNYGETDSPIPFPAKSSWPHKL